MGDTDSGGLESTTWAGRKTAHKILLSEGIGAFSKYLLAPKTGAREKQMELRTVKALSIIGKNPDDD